MYSTVRLFNQNFGDLGYALSPGLNDYFDYATLPIWRLGISVGKKDKRNTGNLVKIMIMIITNRWSMRMIDKWSPYYLTSRRLLDMRIRGIESYLKNPESRHKNKTIASGSCFILATSHHMVIVFK